jgi:2,5-furandicarboxylate decarboxylase 1
MAHRDLGEFVRALKKAKEILVVKDKLSAKFEIPAALRHADRTNQACLYFPNVKGSSVPILGGVFATRARLALAMGVREDRLMEAYLQRRQKPIAPVLRKSGPVQEVVEKKVDILKTIPVLTHHQKDVSPYITTGVSIAKDPETGLRSIGLHRIEVKDGQTLGIYLGSPPLSSFFRKADAMGKPMPIAIALGPDPLTFFSSVIFAPSGVDKLDIAGGLAKRPVELVKCQSVDLEVPAHAQFVVEGEVLPGIRQKEGPFGESTGYYFTFDNPVIKVKAVTHRKEPIYHALMAFGHEESVLLNFSWESDQLRAMKEQFPEVKKVHFPPITLSLMGIVQVAKTDDARIRPIIEHLFEAGRATKVAIVVDEDVDPEDPREIQWALATRFQPDRDIFTESNKPGLGIDPSAGANQLTSKIGIDATKPMGKLKEFEKIDVPPAAMAKAKRILSSLKR